jgi:hypothetical protein
VNAAMIPCGFEHHEVGDVVVRAIAVLVVDLFTRLQKAAEALLHDKSMLDDVTADIGRVIGHANPDISGVARDAATFPVPVIGSAVGKAHAFIRTEALRLLARLEGGPTHSAFPHFAFPSRMAGSTLADVHAGARAVGLMPAWIGTKLLLADRALGFDHGATLRLA